MKKYLLILFIILVHINVQAQWNVVLNTDDVYNTMDFKENFGVIGSRGFALTTYDHGDTWEEIKLSNSKYNMTAVVIIDSVTAAALVHLELDKVDSTILLITKDKGRTWKIELSMTQLNQYHLNYDEQHEMIYMSNSYGLFRYDLKRKRNLQVHQIGLENKAFGIMMDMSFEHSDTLYFSFLKWNLDFNGKVPDTVYIMRTINGGLNWSRIAYNDSIWLTPFIFTDLGSWLYMKDDKSLLYSHNNWDQVESRCDVLEDGKIHQDYTMESLVFNKNGNGLWSGGFESASKRLTTKCTIVQLLDFGKECTVIYDSIGLPIYDAHVVNDSVWIVMSRYGLAMKTNHSGGNFPSDYPWYKVPRTSKTKNITTDDIQIIPNPIMDKLCIQHQGYNINQWRIYDLNGRTVKFGNYLGDCIDVSKIGHGTYFLQMILKNGEVASKTFIVIN